MGPVSENLRTCKRYDREKFGTSYGNVRNKAWTSLHYVREMLGKRKGYVSNKLRTCNGHITTSKRCFKYI